MAQRTIFTHIPKVAGTSVMHQLVRPNFAEDAIKQFRGAPDLIRSRADDWAMLVGHSPYGVHHLAGGDCRYFVMLREPVRRALSHYYFIRKRKADPSLPVSNPEQKRLHQSVPLGEIFEETRRRRYRLFSTWLVDNMQTRYLAGWHHYWLPSDSSVLLRAAKRNLEQNYAAFGLQEHFAESLDRIASQFGWTIGEAQERHKATPPFNPPSEADLAVVKAEHVLDADLYDFAQRLFAKG